MCARARIVLFVLREVDFERVLGDVELVGKREADHLGFHGDISVKAGPLQQTRAELHPLLLAVQLRVGPSTQIDAPLQRVGVVVRHVREEARIHRVPKILRERHERYARVYASLGSRDALRLEGCVSGLLLLLVLVRVILIESHVSGV